jgi:hypothetical protein
MPGLAALVESLVAFRAGAVAVCVAADRNADGLRRFTRDANETDALAKAAASPAASASEVARLLAEVEVAAAVCVDVCTIFPLVLDAATGGSASDGAAPSPLLPAADCTTAHAMRSVLDRSLCTLSTVASGVARAASTSQEGNRDNGALLFGAWSVRREAAPGNVGAEKAALRIAAAAARHSNPIAVPPPRLAAAPMLILGCLAALIDRCRGLRQRALILLTTDAAEQAGLGHLAALTSLCALVLHPIAAWYLERVMSHRMSSVLEWSGPALHEETTVASTTLIAQLPAVIGLLGSGSQNLSVLGEIADEKDDSRNSSLLSVDVTCGTGVGSELLAAALRVMACAAATCPHAATTASIPTDAFTAGCAMRDLDVLMTQLEHCALVHGIRLSTRAGLDDALDATELVRDHLADVLSGATPAVGRYFKDDESDSDYGEDDGVASLLRLVAVLTWATCTIAGGTRCALWFRLLTPSGAASADAAKTFPEATGLRQLFRGTTDAGSADAARVLRSMWLQWVRH